MTTASTSPDYRLTLPAMPAFARPTLSRRWALGAIAAGHLALFYLVQNGMLVTPPKPVLPQEIFVQLITAPAPVKPQPQPKKAVAEPVKQKPLLTTPTLAKPVQPTITAVEIPPAPVAPAPVQRVESRIEPVAPPAAPPANGTPKIVTSGIEYVRPPQPVYPAMSRRLGEQGTVMLRVLVSDQGRPEKVDVLQSSGSVRLDEAARQAVLRAQFKPYSDGGINLAMYASVPIKFETNG
ncbi:MAG TPA: TonB family protein [Burkholderiaceae bacterium]